MEHKAVGMRQGGGVLPPEVHGEALDGSEHEICLESDLWIVDLAVAKSLAEDYGGAPSRVNKHLTGARLIGLLCTLCKLCQKGCRSFPFLCFSPKED